MLYSEMIATKSAIHGDRNKILSFSPEEKPLALQVGGSDKKELSPALGSIARARLQAQINFVGTELHKSFSPLFKKDSTEDEKEAARKKVALRLDDVEAELSDGRAFLLGDDFSIADAYLFTVANWTKPTGLGLGERPNLMAYMARVSERPSVQAALQAEGLIKKEA